MNSAHEMKRSLQSSSSDQSSKKRKHHSESDSSSCERVKLKKKKHKRKDSESHISDGHKKKKKKKHKKLKEEKKNKGKKSKVKEKPEPLVGPAVPEELLERSKQMAPMTEKEWEKKQSIIQKVYDPESGRTRLIRGSGEILEEIVSRDMHKQINKQATKGDGEYFQAVLSNKHS